MRDMFRLAARTIPAFLVALLVVPGAHAYTISCGSAPVDSGPQNEAREVSPGFCDDRATASLLPYGIEVVSGAVRSFGLSNPSIPADDDWFILPDAASFSFLTVSVIVLNSNGLLLTLYDENQNVLGEDSFTNEGAFEDLVVRTPLFGGPIYFRLLAMGDGDFIGYDLLIDVARVPVPEPASGLLLAGGLAFLARRRRV